MPEAIARRRRRRPETRGSDCESARVPGGDFREPRHPHEPGGCLNPDEAAALARRGRPGRRQSPGAHWSRGKAGGVKLARSPEETREAASAILGLDIRGHTVRKVLVAPAVDIAQEFYLGSLRSRTPSERRHGERGGRRRYRGGRSRTARADRAHPGRPVPRSPCLAGAADRLHAGLAADRVAGFATIARQLYDTYLKGRRRRSPKSTPWSRPGRATGWHSTPR